MKVREILKSKGSKVWSVQAKQTIKEAVQILTDHKIGALMVYDGQSHISGIVTERDVMRALQQYGKNAVDTPVSKIMTERVVIGSPEDDLDYIMGIMTLNRCRHIPIIENNELQGVVSIGDVVKAQLHDSQVQLRYLKDYMQGS